MMVSLIEETLNESDEVWRGVHQNMKLVKSYVNYIKSKQTIALTLLSMAMFDWMKKKNESYEVWRWVHLNYGMIQILRKL